MAGNENDKLVQMKKGLLEYCVLMVISKGEVYSSDLIEMLKRVDIIVVEGTMYPLMTRLKNAGLVDYVWKESEQGPPRKYFTLSEAGKQALQQLDEAWQQLQQSINQLQTNL